jgi:hypothetical protein
MITDALRFAPSTAPPGDVQRQVERLVPLAPRRIGRHRNDDGFRASPLANDSVPEVAV